MAFTYATGRAGEYAKQILEGFTRTLQVDGYAGYNRLLKRQEGAIWLAHARRKLFDVAKAGTTTPIADEDIGQIRELYRIEKEMKGNTPGARMTARQERSKPIINQMELWLRETRSRASAKSPIGEALSYIAKH